MANPRWVTARQVAKHRDLDLCIICGRPGLEVHHRLLRSRGGDHNPANLLTLCTQDHQTVHHRPDYATSMGWMLSQYDYYEPWHRPFLVRSTRWVLPTEEGTLIDLGRISEWDLLWVPADQPLWEMAYRQAVHLGLIPTTPARIV